MKESHLLFSSNITIRNVIQEVVDLMVTIRMNTMISDPEVMHSLLHLQWKLLRGGVYKNIFCPMGVLCINTLLQTPAA